VIASGSGRGGKRPRGGIADYCFFGLLELMRSFSFLHVWSVGVTGKSIHTYDGPFSRLNEQTCTYVHLYTNYPNLYAVDHNESR
jgi:hypothetical protein